MKYRRIEATLLKTAITGMMRLSVDLTDPNGLTILEWIQRLDTIKNVELTNAGAYYLGYFVMMDPQPEDHAKNETRNPKP